MDEYECKALLNGMVASVLPEGSAILRVHVTQPKTDDESKYEISPVVQKDQKLRFTVFTLLCFCSLHYLYNGWTEFDNNCTP